MKVFHCDHCQNLLFFENVVCVRCGRALAYVSERRHLASLDPLPPEVRGDAGGSDGRAPVSHWTSPSIGRPIRLCANYTHHDVCNWALPLDDDGDDLCRACRLTRTIPNLGKAGNDRLWYKLEVAKRRVLYTLDELALPVEGKSDDPKAGLAFEFLEGVTTGHMQGVITVNIAEADDAQRVKVREALREPYRTLLGHLRHESGHYYWDRLIAGSAYLADFRRIFGDERADYAQAMKRNYEQGPPQGWQDSFISAYAAMHPWEDWAETWAHYLHMVDTLDTASACGIRIDPPRRDEPSLSTVPNPASNPDVPFDAMMNGWTTITYVLNSLNRGLGNDDAYPFVLSVAAMTKLRFVHQVIAGLSTAS